MPWRKDKYKSPKQGKHGPIYDVARGVTVRKDSRKLWTINIEKGGVRKNKTIGEGREGLVEALKKAETLAGKLDQITRKKPESKRKSSCPMFKTYSQDWLDRCEKKLRPATNRRYEEVLRIHIWPYEGFRNIRVDNLSRREIKNFLHKLFKTRSAASVEIAHSILCGILEEAVDDQLISSNPARNLRNKVLPPRSERNVREVNVFSMEERNLFLEQAEKVCSWPELLVFKVMALSGMRLGEALALRRENLDLENMAYEVKESFGAHGFGKPKSKNGYRSVDLPDDLIEEMEAYILHLRKKALQDGRGTEVDLLFLDPKEKYRCPYSQRKIQDIMRKVCRLAGLKRRHPHELRHTYATIMLLANQSPAYVKEQLGHYSIQMTVDTYGHLRSGKSRKGLEEALYGSVRNPDGNRKYS